MANENGDTQRWQYALKLSESNNEQISRLTENVQAMTDGMQTLKEESKRQAREQERFRAAMMAGLQAYLDGDEPTDRNA